VTGPTGRATVVRPEAAADAGAIRDLLVRAFETPIEADLVERLRHDRDLVLAMVAADCEHGIVGHVAFPRLHVDHMGQEFPAVGLAPLAVAEAHRRQGVGADLVCRGLDCLASRGEVLAFVLGDPAYYTRFGFAVATAKPFTCAYAGSHFMALQLADTAPPAGTVRYPAAFDGLT
jgi:putative acetyltransferase